jgi:hypothetical protein
MAIRPRRSPRPPCWLVEAGRLSPCPDLASRYPTLVCLHTHSCYSIENLASLNWVMDLPCMRPFKGTLRRAFGLPPADEVDYRHLCYNPPFRPHEIWRLEAASASALGVDRLLLAITDHDDIAGGVELREQLPAHADQLALGEELTIRFEQSLYHLGVTGLPPDRLADLHASLQQHARDRNLDAVFETLASAGCLTVLNHPLLDWSGGTIGAAPVLTLLRRYGWAIDALEINGMRTRLENDAVAALAAEIRKPMVGGGDSHLLLGSSALSASRATTYAEFVAEVKAGESHVVVTPGYFLPLRWRLTLRVLSFIAQYRTIATYRQEPVRTMLAGRWILLDPVGAASRLVLRLADRFGVLA